MVQGAQPLCCVETMRVFLRLVMAVLLVAVGIAPGLAGAEEFALQTDHFRLRYPAGKIDKARVAGAAGEIAAGTLSRALDVELDGYVTVRLFATRTDMFAALGEKPRLYVMGLAVPERNEILLGITGDESLKRTMVHELAHIMLFRRFGEVEPHDQPRWLHEGVAQFAAGELTPGQREVLGKAVVSGKLLDLQGMEAAFGGASGEQGLAYAEAFVLVDYLHAQKPSGGIAELVENIEKTGDLGRAFVRTYGMTQAEIEDGWTRTMRSEFVSAALPVSTEMAILGVMGLLFIIVVVVVGRRRAAIRARLQEEEMLREAFLAGIVEVGEDWDGTSPPEKWREGRSPDEEDAGNPRNQV